MSHDRGGGTAASDRRRPCNYFLTSRGCRFGNACRFAHSTPQQGTSTPSPTHNNNASEQTSDADFRAWRMRASTNGVEARRLGPALARFFQQAYKLANTEPGVMQEVIKVLASEGGLQRISELAGKDFEAANDAEKKVIFTTQVFPFFQTVSHPSVLVSAVLEQYVGTIYNFIYGLSGQRAIKIFQFTVNIFGNIASQLTAEEADDFASWVETALAVFSKIVDINGTAAVNEDLKPLVVALAGLITMLNDGPIDVPLPQACKHLERIQRRLGLGLDLPEARTMKSNVIKASFILQQDPPGGRHDNDSEDICDIRIMPTFEEIQCARREYLPTSDPSHSHLAGLDGLLDRQFRLLREDTVGQLRDAVRVELETLQDIQQGSADSRHPRNGPRTYTYANVILTRLFFTQWKGLQFEINFDQPSHLKKVTARERRDWWDNSKRLQPDSLLCLLDSHGSAIFCFVVELSKQNTPLSVSAQDVPSAQDTAARSTASAQDNGHSTDSSVQRLSDDPDRASVTLALVQSDTYNVQHILKFYGNRNSGLRISGVEFPGVLLPSFQPTLLALQRMKKSGDLPFSHLLAPTDPNATGLIDVPPPSYAAQRGFSFNLGCLMRNHGDLYFTPGEDFDIKALQDGSDLDDAQAVALVDSLSHGLALIQGPPGTGKSYTGVAIIKVLLANRARADLGPIVCVCYTNHALDQLLEHLVKSGIEQIVRVGSRSKSEMLEPLNLRNVAKKMEKTKTEKHMRWQCGKALEDDEKEVTNILARVSNTDSHVTLKAHLREFYCQQYAELFGTDEEGWETVNHHPENTIPQWLRSGSAGPSQSRPFTSLIKASLHTLSRMERRRLYQHWILEITRGLQDELQIVLSSYQDNKSNYDRIKGEVDLRCLQQANVIGITTSGLARNQDLLYRLRAKVMLCEEAGEVLEAHILTALLPSVEHAILIGDHLQLRPQIQNYELQRENPRGEQFSLDVSLFERLVQPLRTESIRIPFSTLETQRRMHPSIAQLVRETLYPSLKDSSAVKNHPEVSGMRHRLFWFDHREPENNLNSQAISTSHSNDFEVEMVAALVSHLVRQGVYEPDDIAVLTPYLGQLQKIRRRLRNSFEIVPTDRDQEDLQNAGMEANAKPQQTSAAKSTLLRTLKVATIDNFQGEEAKVVVISLVRSNNQNRCGFLKTSNRINVLLSRAKHGMYIIGNSHTSRHVPMWADVLSILREAGNIGNKLELQCPRHSNTPIAVAKPDDFSRWSPEGGCDQKCIKRLQCGHACIQKCHSDMLHSTVRCLEPCPRSRDGCDHACPRVCGDACDPKCRVDLYDEYRTLPCGHEKANLPCWQSQDLSTVRCEEQVKRIVPGCKHKITLDCWKDVTSKDFVCEVECGTILPCGHTCKNRCHICRDRDVDRIIQENHGVCQQRCGRVYSTCNHSCITPCHGDSPCPLCQNPCEVRCNHSKCQKKCYEPCTPCAEERCASACPHSSCSMPCAAPCDWLPCSKRCEKSLSCGHQCPSVCGELCPSEKFCQICAKDCIKDTQVDYIEMLSYKEIDLDEDPCLFPLCGHFMTLANMDGHMDMHAHYNVTVTGTVTAFKASSTPFSMHELKTCPKCRGSIRNLSRYGRIVRRALLDEATKKFIVWANQEYVPLAQRLCSEQERLGDLEASSVDLAAWSTTGDLAIRGSRRTHIKTVQTFVAPSKRYRSISKLRNEIDMFLKKVRKEEQPFKRVWDMVQNVRRRRGVSAEFTFDDSVLQTRGFLLATSLLLRCDALVVSDFVSLARQAPTGTKHIQLHLDFAASRQDCLELAEMAKESSYPRQQVEGYIYFAQYAAFERATTTSEEGTRLKDQATAYLNDARTLCDQHLSQTNGLLEEIEDAERMLRDSVFYSSVSNEEWRAVLTAMAGEFRVTGHWYYCENGHPFTVGECGMPMQTSRCPQCGATVGGTDHRPVQGVSRADELELQLREMHLDA